MEFQIDPKSFEGEQETNSKHKNEKKEAVSAPQSLQNHNLSALSPFWSASRRDKTPRESPGSSPKRPQEPPRVAQETPKRTQKEPTILPKLLQDHLGDKKSIIQKSMNV